MSAPRRAARRCAASVDVRVAAQQVKQRLASGLEVGLVVHFAKVRGRGALAGVPQAGTPTDCEYVTKCLCEKSPHKRRYISYPWLTVPV